MNHSIVLKNISKRYKRYASKWHLLLNNLTNKHFKEPVEKWVLKNINLTIHKGEALGIVGQNGSGKSTLLKLVTGVSKPTQGEIFLNGRVTSLLELGMGFNSEFTGKQNAEMACQLQGLNNDTIYQLMNDILEFSELGDYFNQPLRTFSTGMQLRLAFSAATILRPDILIIDEALSVGDVYFQHKCIERIKRFNQAGTTLLFVSHDAAAIKALCNRAILLENGVITQDDEPDTVLNYYNAVIAQKEKDQEIKQVEKNRNKTITRSGNGKANIEHADLYNANRESSRAFIVGETAILRSLIRYNEYIKDATFGIIIRDRLGNDIFGTNTYHLNHHLSGETGLLEIEFELKLNLGVGQYSIGLASHTRDVHINDSHDWVDNLIAFQILPQDSYHFVGVSFLPVAVSSKKLVDERNEIIVF